MYHNKIIKDKESLRFLESGIGLKQRKKISVKLDSNKYFDKGKEEKKEKKDKKKDNKKKY